MPRHAVRRKLEPIATAMTSSERIEVVDERSSARLPERVIWSDNEEDSHLRQNRLDEFGTHGGRRRSRGYNPYSDDEADEEFG